MAEVGPEHYARVLRQAAHDAVRAVLAAPPESEDGSRALREVIDWLAAEYGAAAVADLAFELALDFAEAVDALAAMERRDPADVADRWFHDQQLPAGDDPLDATAQCRRPPAGPRAPQ